jgi:hypothetical protein
VTCSDGFGCVSTAQSTVRTARRRPGKALVARWLPRVDTVATGRGGEPADQPGTWLRKAVVDASRRGHDTVAIGARRPMSSRDSAGPFSLQSRIARRRSEADKSRAHRHQRTPPHIVSWRPPLGPLLWPFCARNVICITIARDDDAHNTRLGSGCSTLITCRYARTTSYDPISGHERSDVGARGMVYSSRSGRPRRTPLV